MKINEKCLPCLINQAIKVCELTQLENREQLYRDLFLHLSTLDFSKSNPEVIGYIFKQLKHYSNNPDPYYELRNDYNHLFLNKLNEFEKQMVTSKNPFHYSIMIATLGNIIDFNPIHNTHEDEIMKWFETIHDKKFTIDHSNKLANEIIQSNTLLYLGDNCGEICLDKLLIKKNKRNESQSYDLLWCKRNTCSE